MIEPEFQPTTKSTENTTMANDTTNTATAQALTTPSGSQKRLYKVELSYTLMIWAESEEAAMSDAAFELKRGDDQPEWEEAAEATEYVDLVFIPDEWRESIPYGGGDDNRTVREILSANKERMHRHHERPTNDGNE